MALVTRSANDTPVKAPPLKHESEDFRRAAEHHAGRGNFATAAWYTHMYRLYDPNPPDSGVDVELDWSEPK